MKEFSIELIELVVSFCSSSKDKASLCSINRLFYSAVTPILYRHIIVHGPRQYLILKDTIKSSDFVQHCIQRLDFSSYSARGSRWSQEEAIAAVTADGFVDFIEQCHQLKELLIGEHLLYVFSSPRLLPVIFQRPLTTLDFTGFCDRKITNLMADSLQTQPLPKFKNLSFFMSMSLTRFLTPFFQHLNHPDNQLERLDLGYTHLSPRVFRRLTHLTRLTHLNLQGCYALHCCSPLIDFLLQNASTLTHLNLNGPRFCQTCLGRLGQSWRQLKELQLGSYRLPTPIRTLRYLTQPDLSSLENLPDLFYLNLTHIRLEGAEQVLGRLAETRVQVVEIHPSLPHLYPAHLLCWSLLRHGRRTYYSRNGVDPRWVCPTKTILLDHQVLSPMNKYWCYSY